MSKLRVVVVVGISGLVACVTAGKDDAPSGAGPASSVDGGTQAAPAEDLSVLTGGRAFDWSSGHVQGRSTHGLPVSAKLLAQNRGLQAMPAVDWNVTTGAPVTSAPATYGTWSPGSATDLLFFGVNGASGASNGITGGAVTTSASANFFALTNLYAASPTIKWAQSLGSGLNRSGVATSVDGTKVFALSSNGTLSCMLMSTGALCGTVASGNATQGSSPWFDYPTSAIYWGDDTGTLHRVAVGNAACTASCLTSTWAFKPGPAASYNGAMRASPVVVGNYIYIGDDDGQVFRVLNGATTPVQTDVSIFDTCTVVGKTAPCTSDGANATTSGSNSLGWEVRAGVSYDTATDNVYVASNDYVFEIQGGSGNWAQTSSSPKHLLSGATGTMSSSPVLDYNNGFVYTGFNSKIFKISYPFTGSSTSGISSTALAGGSGASNPTADPLPYSSAVYVGDTGGLTERFGCATVAGPTAIDGVTASTYGSAINTPMVLDSATGNVNFGYTNGTGGGLVQYPLAVTSYSCPSGQHLCTASNGVTNTCVATAGGNYGDACRGCCSDTDCSGGTPKCVSGTCKAACVTAADCPALSNTTKACTASACVYTCVSPYANCDGTISTNGCTTNTNTDVNNCGGCGSACSNNHIPSPSCVAATCTGHCADGYVDCDGNRKTNGCEAAATCGSCCGTTCTSGQTCYDNGGTGTCATGQTTQTSGSNSEGSAIDLACPTGQKISGITFADYGTPYGTASQSFSTTAACASQGTSGACTAVTGCRWTGSACVAFSCPTFTTSATCGAQTGCTWNATSQGCIDTACSGLTAVTCAANAACTYISAISTCVSATGFVHDYGTYTPDCAMDVSANSVLLAACPTGSTVGSCTFTPANGTMGTGTNPTSPKALPLTLTPPNPSGYPSDPCANVYKRMYLQAACGTCGTFVSYASVVAASSPVSWWKLDDASGATNIVNTQGSGNGTVAGSSTNAQTALLIGQPTGTSISLTNTSATTNRIGVAYSATNNQSASFSVEGWFNFTAATGANMTIIESLSTTGGNFFGYWVYIDTVNRVVFQLGNRTLTSPSGYIAGTTHHVVATWDSTGTNQTLYIDGASVVTNGNNNSRTQAASPTPLYIGCGGTEATAGQAWNGKLDEIAIYSTLLTPAAILNHYNRGLGN